MNGSQCLELGHRRSWTGGRHGLACKPFSLVSSTWAHLQTQIHLDLWVRHWFRQEDDWHSLARHRGRDSAGRHHCWLTDPIFVPHSWQLVFSLFLRICSHLVPHWMFGPCLDKLFLYQFFRRLCLKLTCHFSAGICLYNTAWMTSGFLSAGPSADPSPKCCLALYYYLRHRSIRSSGADDCPELCR